MKANGMPEEPDRQWVLRRNGAIGAAVAGGAALLFTCVPQGMLWNALPVIFRYVLGMLSIPAVLVVEALAVVIPGSPLLTPLEPMVLTVYWACLGYLVAVKSTRSRQIARERAARSTLEPHAGAAQTVRTLSYSTLIGCLAGAGLGVFGAWLAQSNYAGHLLAFPGLLFASLIGGDFSVDAVGLDHPLVYWIVAGNALFFGFVAGAFGMRRVALIRRGRGVPAECCRECGYGLIGNVSGRCPECGCVVGECGESESGEDDQDERW